jgi:glycosyltransferase involved in cell wall biosynthesis
MKMAEEKASQNLEEKGHVLFLTPAFPPHIGGVEKHTSRVSQELLTKGYKVTVVTRKSQRTDNSFENLNGLQVYRIDKKNPLTLSWWLYRNKRYFQRVSIIHCHDLETLIFWLMPARFLFLHSKVFLTLHGFDRYPIPLWTKLLRKFGLKLVKSSICVGSFIERWYGLKCNSVIVGGVNIPDEFPSVPSQSIIATFVGRIAEDTGFSVYIEALNILKKKGIEIILHVCGNGPLRTEMEKRCSDLALDVRFNGFVRNPEIFIQKTRYVFATGFLSILEGMANKRAVFCVYENEMKKDYLASIPDAPNTVFISSNPESLAKTLMWVLKNPEKERLFVERGRLFAESQGWGRIGELYHQLYQSK